MKLKQFLPLCLAALVLCGCGKNTVPPPETVETIRDTTQGTTEETLVAPDSNEAQLDLIWENKDTWKVLDESDGWCYAVTDLDGNGQLEILSSECHGTGHFITFRAWEVSEDGATLVPIAEEEEYGSTVAMFYTAANADLAPEAVPCYRDPQTGVYYYIQSNTIKVSAFQYCETTTAVYLLGNRMEREILGYAVTDYEPSETVTYQDAEEQTISEEAYASLPATRFAGMEARTAYIGWLPDLHQEDLTLQLLQTSWEGSCTVK